jgi:hypothetical protein
VVGEAAVECGTHGGIWPLLGGLEADDTAHSRSSAVDPGSGLDHSRAGVVQCGSNRGLISLGLHP